MGYQVYPLTVRGGSVVPGDVYKLGRILNARALAGTVYLLVEDDEGKQINANVSPDQQIKVLRPILVPDAVE